MRERWDPCAGTWMPSQRDVGVVTAIVVAVTVLGFLALTPNSAARDEPWWQEPIARSMKMGPPVIKPLPFGSLSGDNGIALLQLLCHTAPVVSELSGELVNIGLPTESFLFASRGFVAHSFEPRRSALEALELQAKQQNLTKLVRLYNSAVSNVTGTAKLFFADDSSSLAQSAVAHGPELEKANKEKGKEEDVKLVTLDFVGVSRADGMKIDTQGFETEVLMGASKILTQDRLPVIIMEYCERLRSFEAVIGSVHLLRGLGYKCYSRPGDPEFTLDLESEVVFCDDLYCTSQPFVTGGKCCDEKCV